MLVIGPNGSPLMRLMASRYDDVRFVVPLLCYISETDTMLKLALFIAS